MKTIKALIRVNKQILAEISTLITAMALLILIFKIFG